METAYALSGPIETERLVLRPFEEGDLEAVLAMQTSPEVARYLYWGPGPRPRGERRSARRSRRARSGTR
jgi:RimJ/RimL family protein N-acetyltransferase